MCACAQGWANNGFHNHGNVITPATDKLASEGIILDRHYTFRCETDRELDSIDCTPTHAAQLQLHYLLSPSRHITPPTIHTLPVTPHVASDATRCQ
jgi:hypothetical protein